MRKAFCLVCLTLLLTMQASAGWSETKVTQVTGVVVSGPREYHFELGSPAVGNIKQGASKSVFVDVCNQGDYPLVISAVAVPEPPSGISIALIEYPDWPIYPNEPIAIHIRFDVALDAPLGDFTIDVDVTCSE